MNRPASLYSGLTWDHPRGYDALAAAAAEWSPQDGTALSWSKQPLEGFESHPIGELLAAHDLVVLDHPHLGDAIASGRILPLESVFGTEEIAAWKRQSIGAAMASYQHGGHSYALPLDVAAQVMASDPARLPERPDSWDDVLTAASRVPVALSLAGPHALSSLYCLCLSLGIEPGGEDLLPGPEAREALRIMASLYKTRPKGSENANPIALLEAMAGAGDIALVPVVFGYVNYAAPGKPRPVRFSEAPRFGQGRRGSVLGGTGIAISTRTPVSESLADHLRWLMDETTQAGFIPAHNGQPSARAAWTSDKVNHAWGEFYRATIETVENAWVRPRFRDYVPFHNDASARLRAWLDDGSDPASFLAPLRTMWRDARARGGELNQGETFQ